MSSVTTPRSRSTAYSASPKSSPTGPITRVSARNEEASEKCTAAPPRRRSRLAVCVSTASNAMDPTTVRLMRARRVSSAAVRAIRISEWGGPEVLELVEDAPVPEPGDGQVLIRVARAGINFADTHARENSYLARYELPLTPGAEVAGVREDTGQRVVSLVGHRRLRGVRRRRRGDHVPDRGGRERRHRAGAPAAGPHRLAPVPDVGASWPRARAWWCTPRPAGSARWPCSSGATWAPGA